MPSLDTAQSICHFGLARGDVTPPVGIYHRMWGAATHDRASGVHRPLSATAMVFRPKSVEPDPAAEQVLIVVDHCLLWAKEMDQLLQSICATTGLAKTQVVVSFSHTHSAGLMGLERISYPGGELIPSYLEKLTATICTLVQRARAAVQPVVITYATGRCRLAAHRDFWDSTSNQFVCGFNPEGPADDAVLVARITDGKNRVAAVLVNYACHPTTLAWENTQISPDYPGALREVVEQTMGAPCVFLQGAAGDLGPREGYVGDVQVAERNGRQLGFAALAALEAMPPPGTRFLYTGPVVSGATLGAWSHVALSEGELERKARWRWKRWQVDLPYRPELPTTQTVLAQREQWLREESEAMKRADARRARDCHAMVERMTRSLTRIAHLPPGDSYGLPVTLWQIGDAFWLAIEAEPYNLLQRSLRERFPNHALIISTLANGATASYLPTAESYGQGIYQESIAVLAAGCLERLIEAISDEMDRWRSS